MRSSHRAPVEIASGMTAQLYHCASRPVIHLRDLGRQSKKKGVPMQMIRHAFALIALLTLASATYADENSAKLFDAVKSAKVSLETALRASQREGKPISAKYELEDGKLQLSVYTAKGNTFSEVIVDHKTGKVAKAEPITGGDDLTAAKAQNEAMTKAKTSLAVAVSKAVKANKGYKAVSAMPGLKDGHPVADVTLMKGADSKTVSQSLD